MSEKMKEAWNEIEILRSIFEEELVVEDKQDFIIVIKKVHPKDDEHGPMASVVCHFTLREGYPEQSPNVELVKPRGLSNSDFEKLESLVQTKLDECKGSPVIFDLIQVCGEFFESHKSSSDLLCPICLCTLSADAVTSTSCDHFLHKKCMDEHILVTRREINSNKTVREQDKTIDYALYCPVCRKKIAEKLEPLSKIEDLSTWGNSDSTMDSFIFDWERWKNEQVKMQVLFEKQQKQGGIIDLEAERQKNLITEETVVVLYEMAESNEALPDVIQIERDSRPEKSTKNAKSEKHSQQRKKQRTAYIHKDRPECSKANFHNRKPLSQESSTTRKQ